MIFTASDLTDFLACGHLTRLEMSRRAAGQAKAERGDAADLIAAKGLSHEARYLQTLRNDGITVVDLGLQRGTPADDAERTRKAMASGVAIIYQATFFDGAWLGRADFLQRVERPGSAWAWSYEVIDTKLSLSPRPTAIMQLCMYSELLTLVQGVVPEHLHIVLGDGRQETYRFDRFSAYYRSLKTTFLVHVAADSLTYPEPVAHCAQCTWSQSCEQRRIDDDHLSQVAWMRHAQIVRLKTSDITTLRALATAEDAARPIGMAPETFVRLRRQARLQFAAREQTRTTMTPVHLYELLLPEAGQGFAKLPPASSGDVYFDMEGDPLYEADRGLEYLFGNYTPDNTFAMFWALTPQDERAAFEACVDFFLARLARDPHMHVYHYAPYEKTALRRLAAEFHSREEEVDRMLAAGIFVDLYEIVRQGVVVSQPGYSIKKLEPFYGFARKTDVKKGDDSIVAFETWRAYPERRDLLDDILHYNEDDCRSTYELRCWLDRLKAEAEGIYACEIAAQASEERAEIPASVVSELRDLRETVVRRLEEQSVGDEARRLLAALIPYHAREAKPVWWEYFDRCDNADSLTEEDGKALGGLVLDLSRPPVKAPRAVNAVYAYTFPSQKFAGDDGDMHDAYLRRQVGSIERMSFNQDGGVVFLKVSGKVDPASIRTLIPHSLVRTEHHERALIALGETIASDATLPRAFAADMLTSTAPRLRGFAPGAIVQPKTVDGLAIADTIARLDHSYLVVQGPPGSGKTTKGAQAIVHLLSRGLRIGITSRSHAAIDNLLSAVDRTAEELGVPYVGVRKPQDEKNTPRYIHLSKNLSAQSKSLKIFADDVQLVAGTSWLFVGKDVPSAFLDVLFIDEAGQFSLADTVALHQVAQNVVLLGDPLQLKQVARGTHPRGADASVLEHLLGSDATIPPERGIFLDVSYRMHPEICHFVSENIYDGRLTAAPKTVLQAVQSMKLSGSGLRFAPIMHHGNSRDAQEEADWIAARVGELLYGEVTDKTNTVRPMEARDILVVTPYNAQRICIEHAFRARGIERVAVGTVDTFQGQEAAVVFYSMATSSAEDLPRDIAFLYELNRFNVAISRAKALCVLVASPELLRAPCKTIEELAMVNLLCRYVEEATIVT